jgi:hypothetical protein
MGAVYHYECPYCGYDADTCGGNQVGELLTATTIICTECQEIYDIYTSYPHFQRRERGGQAPALDPVCCPRDSRHTCRLWHHPGPCPRCGVTMRRIYKLLEYAC